MRDDCFQIGICDVLFLVADVFEFLKTAVNFFPGQVIAHLFQMLGEGMTSGVFAQNQTVGDNADSFRCEDFVGLLIRQHTVLMNAGFVRHSCR